MNLFPEKKFSNFVLWHCIFILFMIFMIFNIYQPHFVKVFLGRLVLSPVVENGVLLGHLPLGVLLVVHVEDAERNDESRKDDNNRQCDGEDVEETAAKVSTFLENIRRN